MAYKRLTPRIAPRDSFAAPEDSRMTTTLTERFRFFSPAQTETPLHVTGFTGVEGLHRLFDFHIDLVCADAAVDTGALLAKPCRFEVLRDGDAAPAVFSGYPARVEQRGFFNGYAYYAVHLRPTFWKLTQIRQSAIFLDKKLEDVLRELMASQPFFQFPHEFRLTAQDYPVPEFAMQYQESLYDYICWRMEEQGAYFYFEEKDGADTVIFADAPQAHDGRDAPLLSYAPASGLEGDRREEVVVSFSLAQTPLPRRVALRSYDWRTPNKPVVGIADVDENGLGDVYLSNEYVDNDAGAARLAAIRAQELRCRGRLFHGASSAPTLRPGRIFRLDRHYNDAFNRDYLVTEITHEGRQDAYLSLGLGIPLRDAGERLYYRNGFTAMEADVPYRPARTAPRTRISGVLRAFVAGDGSGARAETDNYGRYRLTFPFDISGRSGGNASCWIRRAQPQVGKDSGLSLPLLPGTEVLVSFVDGNPDLPVIAGALTNGETGSISGADNTNFQGLRTPGGNQITINDTDSKQGISLMTAAGSGLTVAAGSTESALLNSAHITQMAGTCGTQMASFGLSQFSGFKVSSGAYRFDKEYYWPALCAALADCAASVTGTLASQDFGEKAQVGLSWGTSGIKLLSAIANAVGDLLVGVHTPPIPYGGALVAEDDMAKTLLQVAPDKGDMLSAAIPYIFSRLGSVVCDSVTVGEEVTAATPKIAYMSALEKAMQDLYGYNATTYAKYANTDTYLEEPCAHYAEVTLDLGKAIAALSEEDDALTEAQTALASAEAAYADNRNDATTKALQKAQQEYSAKQNTANEHKEQKAAFEESLSRLETTWQGYCANDKKANAYFKNLKHNSGRAYLVDTVAALIPEIVSLILFYKAYNPSKRLGGILLRAQDRNITMTAQNAIAMHTQGGFLRNTRDLPLAPTQKTDMATAIGTTLEDNGGAELGVLTPYVDAGKKRTGMEAAAYWGVKVNDHTKATDFMNTDIGADFTCTLKDERKNGDDIRDKATFIADTTELHYMRNLWSCQHSEENARIVADKELALESGPASVRLHGREKDADYPKGLFLATGDAQAMIRLQSQKEGDDAPFTETTMTPDQAVMAHRQNNGDAVTLLGLNNAGGTLKTATSGFLATGDCAVMGVKKAAVTCAGNAIHLTAKTVSVGDIQLSGTSIKGAKGGVLTIGDNAIKVCVNVVSSGDAKNFSAIEEFDTGEYRKINIKNV